jgi:excisionase family DNA binding protein
MEEKDLIKACIKAQAIYDANNTCLSVAECAKWLGVHNDTVLRRLHDGKIKGSFVGVWSIPKIQFLDKIVKDWK